MIGIDNRFCAISLAAASATICPSAIAASFDGNWSVVAQTTQGHCGSMQFGLAIKRGRLYSAGGYYVFGYPGHFAGSVISITSTVVKAPDVMRLVARNGSDGSQFQRAWPRASNPSEFRLRISLRNGTLTPRMTPVSQSISCRIMPQ
jgi:hypothetical protein